MNSFLLKKVAPSTLAIFAIGYLIYLATSTNLIHDAENAKQLEQKRVMCESELAQLRHMDLNPVECPNYFKVFSEYTAKEELSSEKIQFLKQAHETISRYTDQEKLDFPIPLSQIMGEK